VEEDYDGKAAPGFRTPGRVPADRLVGWTGFPKQNPELASAGFFLSVLGFTNDRYWP